MGDSTQLAEWSTVELIGFPHLVDVSLFDNNNNPTWFESHTRVQPNALFVRFQD